MGSEQSLFSQLPIPLAFSCMELGSDRIEYATQTVGILADGFVITSRRKLRTGDMLCLRMRMPPGTLEGAFWELHRIARVTAELPRRDGAFCYRVEYERVTLPA